MPATPKRSPAPRPPRAKATPKYEEPQPENEDTQEASEAAQANALLAELMSGTPRQRKLSGGFGPNVNVASQHKKQRSTDEQPEDAVAERAISPADGDSAGSADAAGEEDDWYADCVLARRRLKPEFEGGPPGEWQYLVRWVGKGPEEDRWVPESALNPEFLQQDMEEALTERRMERTTIG